MSAILEQLGGSKFVILTGAKDIINEGNIKLQMNLPRNMSRANHLLITVEQNNTYKMIFSKITELNHKTLNLNERKNEVIKIFDDVYRDQLQELFTKVTGMYTTL